MKMNEKIKELAEQAAHETRLAHNNAYWRIQDEFAEDSTWRERFAELIVADCTEIVRWVLREENSNLDYATASLLQKKMKDNFGIE